jgi:outer membrane receptor protein involved in Fe transport
MTIFTPVPGLLDGGLTFRAQGTTYRVGTSFDGDVGFGDRLQLLFGAEAFHEWLPDTSERSRQGPGPETTFPAPYVTSRLPFICPSTGGMYNPMNQSVTGSTIDPSCPLTFVSEVNRQTVGGFASLQYRPNDDLTIDAGARLQAAPELFARSRGYGLAPTLGVAVVYGFLPDWHAKLNYSEGFRPPVFNNTDSNGEAVQIDGDPNLRVERSRSTQVEVNARLLKGVKRVRELNLRADLAYSTIDDYIGYVGGRYRNVGDRGIRSGELLAKLYLTGGHRLELAYTANYVVTTDQGAYLGTPHHWFRLSAVHRLARPLELATVLRVYGAFQDANRRIEARGLTRDPVNGSADLANPQQTVTVAPTEMVIDRMPPAAELQIGVRWWPGFVSDRRLELQATAHNALGNLRPSYDNFNLEPRFEIGPTQFEGFRLFVSATMRL